MLSDAFSPEYLRAHSQTQRCGTFLVYLTDVALGGETHFPQLGRRITPRKGRAVWFEPSKHGQIDYRLVHAALPVVQGAKYVLQIWCRERGILTEKK